MDMDGFVINSLLQEIIDQVAYKQGYDKITRKVFLDDIDYETAIAAVQRIIDENISYNSPQYSSNRHVLVPTVTMCLRCNRK